MMVIELIQNRRRKSKKHFRKRGAFSGLFLLGQLLTRFAWNYLTVR